MSAEVKDFLMAIALRCVLRFGSRYSTAHHHFLSECWYYVNHSPLALFTMAKGNFRNQKEKKKPKKDKTVKN